MDVLSEYFTDERLKLAFTFQAKYLGMSPWNCPALFSILSYIEYAHGIYHVQGGLSNISAGMAKVFEEEGGKIHAQHRGQGNPIHRQGSIKRHTL